MEGMETRIIPYSAESLMELVVTEGGGNNYLGNATLSLPDLNVFDGALDLRANDKVVGEIHITAGWQLISGDIGQDLLQSCLLASAKR